MSSKTKYAVLDVETTGLSFQEDRIIEIAILIYENDEIKERFVSLVNPEQRIFPGIIRLTGITNEMVQSAPKFYEIARKIVEMTKGTVLVGHNVRFDYGFLKQEFSRLAYRFQRRQICTMRLGRKVFPGMRNYSLSAMCRYLKLSQPNAHRAENDALAAAMVFDALKKLLPDATLEKAQKNITLPPAMTREQIHLLPEAVGVYFFYDGRRRLLYVGKSNCIRKRVMGHFSNDLKSSKSGKLKRMVKKIDYVLTGSELIALLLESDIIKKKKPPFNRSQRNTTYRHGLFQKVDKAGYIRLFTAALEKNSEPLIAFSSIGKAKNYLERLVKTAKLCQKMCGLDKSKGPCFQFHLKQCQGACAGVETPAVYNERVEKALHRFNYSHSNFLIISEGRSEKEISVVLIEEGEYKGFGYADQADEESIEKLKTCIDTRKDNQDIRKIINGYLKQHKDCKMIYL